MWNYNIRADTNYISGRREDPLMLYYYLLYVLDGREIVFLGRIPTKK